MASKARKTQKVVNPEETSPAVENTVEETAAEVQQAPLLVTFARRLRLMRTAQGFSQSQLSRILGVSRSTYTRYECGTSYPSLDLLRRLIDALCEGDPRFLLMLTDDQPKIGDLGARLEEERLLLLYYRTLDEEPRKAIYESVSSQSMKKLDDQAAPGKLRSRRKKLN